jgi:hypothetical protein
MVPNWGCNASNVRLVFFQIECVAILSYPLQMPFKVLPVIDRVWR